MRKALWYAIPLALAMVILPAGVSLGAWSSANNGTTYDMSDIAALTSSVSYNSTTNEYVVTDDIIIQNLDTLVISGGTTVAFTGSITALVIEGTLEAEGSQGNLITFTTTSGTPGLDAWGGIIASGADATATLSYCRVEYARIETSSPSRVPSMSVSNCEFYGSHAEIEDATYFSFNDNSMESPTNNGVVVNLFGSSVSSFRNNTMTDTTTYCIINLDPSLVGAFSGNTLDCTYTRDIELEDTVYPECVSSTTTWSQAAVYHVRDDICVVNSGSITIAAPGAVFEFDTGINIDVDGSFIVDGTTASPITFKPLIGTGHDAWPGLIASGGSSDEISLDNVRWSYGDIDIVGGASRLGKSAISNSWFTELTIAGSSIDDFSFDGNSVDCQSGAAVYPLTLTSDTITSINGNAFTGESNNYLIYGITPVGAGGLANNEFSGALTADVYIAPGDSILGDVTWSQVADFHLDAQAFVAQSGKLTINGAGSNYYLSQGNGQFRSNGGSIIVDGTTADPILITNDAADPSSGYFAAFLMISTAGGTVDIDAARIEYGYMAVVGIGAEPVNSFSMTNSRMYYMDFESMNVDDFAIDGSSVTINPYLSYGSVVYLLGDVAISSMKNNVFTGTGSVDYILAKYPGAYLGALSGNTYDGGLIAQVEVDDQSSSPPCATGVQNWGDKNILYQVKQDLCIDASGDVTVTATGSTFAFGAGLGISCAGSFAVDADSGAEIAFYPDAVPPSSGTWDGIDMSSTGADFSLDYVDWLNGPITTSASGNLATADITNSALTGLVLDLTDVAAVTFDANSVDALSGATPAINLTGSTVTSFDNNSIAGGGGTYAVTGYPPQSLGHITNNTITGFTTAEFYVYSDALVCASDSQNGSQSNATMIIASDVCVGPTGSMSFTGPGTKWTMNAGSDITVNGGSFALAGNTANRMILRGPVSPYTWDGLAMNSGAGRTFSLNHVVVGPAPVLVSSSGANMASSSITNSWLDGARVALKDSNAVTFSGNSVDGPSSASESPLDLEGSTVLAISSNSIAGTGNEYLINNVAPKGVGAISGNALSGSGSYDLFVDSPGAPQCIAGSATWSQIASYLIGCTVCIDAGGKVTAYLPGATVKFAGGANFSGEGSLDLSGSAVSRINISGVGASWGGVNLTPATTGSLAIKNAKWDGGPILADGGTDGMGPAEISGCSLTESRVALLDSSSVTFTNNALTTSAGETNNALDVEGSTLKAITGNSIQGASGQHVINGVAPQFLGYLSGNSLSGCLAQEIRAAGESVVAITNVQTWNQAGDYLFETGVQINAGGSVMISLPGSKLSFAPDIGVICNGKLEARGQQGNYIEMTSAETTPAPGDWSGIRVNSSGQLTLERIIVDYATYGVYAYIPSALNLNLCQVKYFGTNALYMRNTPVSTVVKQNYFTGTNGYVMNLVNSTGKFENNVLFSGNNATIRNSGTPAEVPDFGGGAFGSAGGNEFIKLGTGYSVMNLSTLDVMAQGNYWGTTVDSEIQDLIYDHHDNASYGEVDYSGYTAGYFQDLQTSPSVAYAGDTISISFTSGNTVSDGPTVTLSGQTATQTSHTGNDYTFEYSVQGASPEFHGENTITIQGSDNEGVPRFRSAITTIVFDRDRDMLCDSGSSLYDGSTLLCLASETAYGTDPDDDDSDDDGLKDGEEVITYSTDPDDDDSDDDGLNDYIETITRPCLDPNDNDSDDDTLLDGTSAGEDKDGDGTVDPGETDPCDADSDDDLMSDSYEVYHSSCLNPTVNDASGDPDEDELTNILEHGNSTDPCDPDSDDDTMEDGWEVTYSSCGLDPLANDASGDNDTDTLTNATEYSLLSNPCNNDTDGDNMLDAYEYANSCISILVGDSLQDGDTDSLTNIAEMGLGSNPCNDDTDGDNMEDGYENAYSCINILVGDSLLDGDTDSLTNVTEAGLGSNPCNDDTDGDNMEDGYENTYACINILVGDSLQDGDTDDLDNITEMGLGSNPCNDDTDGDNMEDGYENTHACINILVGDSLQDGDTDDLDNITEMGLGSNPCNDDTDGDNMEDGYEYDYACINILVGDSLQDGDTDDLDNITEMGLGSNPCNDDTDGDNMEDGYEYDYACINILVGDSLQDGDTDDLNNITEMGLGSNPCNDDTDGDNMEDGYENTYACINILVGDSLQDGDTDDLDNITEAGLGSNPCNDDTDGDNMEDGYEYDYACINILVGDSLQDGDTDDLNNITEMGLGSNPCNDDTDGDNMEDGYENTYACINILVGDSLQDGDTDDLDNITEAGLGSNPCNEDTDGDDMEDGYENSYACINILVGDSLLDGDADGLTNLTEHGLGSNPCDEDTDGDGMDDYYENGYACVNIAAGDSADDYDRDSRRNITEYKDGTDPCVADDGEIAAYSGSYGAPYCQAGVGPCIVTSDIIQSRDNITGGSEPNQPNTLTVSSCADGSVGSYWSDESLEAFIVEPLTGDTFFPGSTVQVKARVFCNAAEYTKDVAYIYHSPSASSPSWTRVGTMNCTVAGGLETLSISFNLAMTGGEQALRVSFGRSTPATACNSNTLTDRDDLVLKVVSLDLDGDGLMDDVEDAWCTDSSDPDTDGDGLCDGDTAVYDGATLLCEAGEDMDLSGSWESGVETDPCSADTDGDTLGDGDEAPLYGTNPILADSDLDGIRDWIEAVKVSCLDALVDDSDSDGLIDGTSLGEDKNGNGVVDAGESSPCDTDSDDDGVDDGDEVNTYSTNPAYWDTDGDGLPDKFEIDNLSGHALNLDPNYSADGLLDFDSDTNPNVHEYWNGTEVWVTSLVGGTGCYCWGDSGNTLSADGLVSPLDLPALKNRIGLKSASYTGVIPPNGDSQELDMDEITSPLDLNILVAMATLSSTSGNPSIPVDLEVVGDATVTVETGMTTRITVGVLNNKPNYTAAMDVVFEINGDSSTGTATVFGGEGADQTGRYDVSGPIASGGRSTVVIRVDTPGTIYVRGRIVGCGTGGKGRFANPIVRDKLVLITGQ